jgi:hypothetical protein
LVQLLINYGKLSGDLPILADIQTFTITCWAAEYIAKTCNGENMFEQVQAAKERLKGYANVTPLMTSRTLNRLIGAEVYFKCENFQMVGAFKFRGAFNSISQISVLPNGTCN